MAGSFTSEDLGGGVRALTLSNLVRKNALDAVSLDQLRQLVNPAETGSVRCWLLRAEGSGPFSSGYDVSSLSEIGEGQLPDDALGDVFDLLASHPAPSVALLTGAAFGAGCELACACDFRVGDTRAAFCLPPSKLGVVYAPRGIRRIAGIVGLARAKWMLLTGRRVDAKRADELGLLDVLTPDALAEDEAMKLTRELAAAAPLAIAGMKRIFRKLSEGELTKEEEDSITELRREAFNSEDAMEGRAAFLEKRKPGFKGR